MWSAWTGLLSVAESVSNRPKEVIITLAIVVDYHRKWCLTRNYCNHSGKTILRFRSDLKTPLLRSSCGYHNAIKHFEASRGFEKKWWPLNRGLRVHSYVRLGQREVTRNTACCINCALTKISYTGQGQKIVGKYNFKVQCRSLAQVSARNQKKIFSKPTL